MGAHECCVPHFLLLISQEMAREMSLHARIKSCPYKHLAVHIVQVLLVVGCVRQLGPVEDADLARESGASDWDQLKMYSLGASSY
jgi:hypothetical protein